MPIFDFHDVPAALNTYNSITGPNKCTQRVIWSRINMLPHKTRKRFFLFFICMFFFICLSVWQELTRPLHVSDKRQIPTILIGMMFKTYINISSFCVASPKQQWMITLKKAHEALLAYIFISSKFRKNIRTFREKKT